MHLKISSIIDDYYEDDIDIAEVDIVKPERVWELVKERLATQVAPIVDGLSDQFIDLNNNDTDFALPPMFDSNRVLALVRKQVPGLGTDDSSRPRRKTILVRILLAAALTIFMSVTTYAIYLLAMADKIF